MLQPRVEIDSPRPVTPEELLAKSESAQQLAAALSSLTPQERQVLTIQFGLEEGKALSLAATARKMGITPHAARKASIDALTKLRGFPQILGMLS